VTPHDGWADALREAVRSLSSRYGYDWTGIYLASGGDLLLGPFVGEPTDHVRIAFGNGICGAAAEAAETIVVDDVASDPRYLSCFLSTRSEIVVPIFRGGVTGEAVIGEIDVDSNARSAFGAEDRAELESVAARLGARAPADALTGVVLNERLTEPSPLADPERTA
jgi:GAF domain-containing protein